MSTQQDITNSLIAVLDELKVQGISAATAAKAIGKSPTTLNSWVKRGRGAKKEHIHKLIQAFPIQLKEKAEEIGILEKATLSDKASIQLRLDSAANMVEEIEVRYKKALQEKSEELEQVKKEREELKKQVSILTELIRQKLD